MLVLSIAQVLLLSMVLGIHIGTTKIGINPFLLLREKIPSPRIKRKLPFPNYRWRRPQCLIAKLLDGHSSTCTFLGFASTIIPFAFVLGAIWRGDQKTWIPATLPWTLFAAGALGTEFSWVAHGPMNR